MVSGTCTTGYQDGGDGTCVMTGTCTTGYKNCSGTCSASFCGGSGTGGGSVAITAKSNVNAAWDVLIFSFRLAILPSSLWCLR